MTPLTEHERQRLLELLADRALGQLELEDRADLESLAARGVDMPDLEPVLGELLVAADDPSGGELPGELRAQIVSRGSALLRQRAPYAPAPAPRLFGLWLTLAACIAIGAVVAGAIFAVASRSRELARTRAELAAMTSQVEENRRVLAAAHARAEQLALDLAGRDDLLEEERARLADITRREVALAEQLARATEELDRAELEIAKYEQPQDPELLKQNRQKLLEVPDTIRVAWQPFNLPDAPAEQAGVQGDVVWNDELQQGYLRFVGLRPNDPAVEQYQVWVIDERGMEQKVSGGIFNATAQGEAIVPIEPGIDVGRVALFAVTIENPGGTWVPDLKRRVVVAPRGEG
jgi:anti-sigma-K factor RskA